MLLYCTYFLGLSLAAWKTIRVNQIIFMKRLFITIKDESNLTSNNYALISETMSIEKEANEN